MPEVSRQVLLQGRPNGLQVPEDVAVAEVPLPEPRDGEVLVRSPYLSLGPYTKSA